MVTIRTRWVSKVALLRTSRTRVVAIGHQRFRYHGFARGQDGRSLRSWVRVYRTVGYLHPE